MARLDFPVGQYGQRKALSFPVHQRGSLHLVGPFKFARRQSGEDESRDESATFLKYHAVVENP